MEEKPKQNKAGHRRNIHAERHNWIGSEKHQRWHCGTDVNLAKSGPHPGHDYCWRPPDWHDLWRVGNY